MYSWIIKVNVIKILNKDIIRFLKYAELNLVPYTVGNIVEYFAVFYYIWYG